MSNKILKHIRINPITGESDYFFPMEVKDDSVLVYAQEYGYEVGWARLGFRKFLAVFVPCKEQVTDSHGKTTYLETPSDVQRRRYLAYIKDELNKQEDTKQDGRCQIPDGHGGLKRCPRRIPNPNYVPGGDEPKTIPVRCEGCVYEQFRQAHTTITLSCLDCEGEDGEREAYEVPAPRNYDAGDRYEELAAEFVAFIKDRKPRLVPLAEKLVQEYNLTDAAAELDKSISTAFSQKEKLKELATEFLDTIISF